MDAGTHTFSWTAATGSNISYQLVFYSYEGAEVESFWTWDTSYTVNLGAETSTGGTFLWEVRAYYNGSNGIEYACVTSRSPALARTEQKPVVIYGTLRVTISCTWDNGGTFMSDVTVSWLGLPGGQTLTATLAPDSLPSTSSSSTAESGTINLSALTYYGADVIVSSTGGFSITKACVEN